MTETDRPLLRPCTPDRTRTRPDGRTVTTITLKRYCSKGHLVGDATGEEIAALLDGRPRLDAQLDCAQCREQLDRAVLAKWGALPRRSTRPPILVRRLPINGWTGLCRLCDARRGLTAPGTVWNAEDQPDALRRGLDHLTRHHAPAGGAR